MPPRHLAAEVATKSCLLVRVEPSGCISSANPLQPCTLTFNKARPMLLFRPPHPSSARPQSSHSHLRNFEWQRKYSRDVAGTFRDTG
ncbi:hypothetical protein BGY98DRAFT_1189706 [Russula aff. rugulosa BPL654]|nr:hypothetical protein BGY98DRAFT_1189706 [Russula aff. rugulosa BPL654]